MKNIAIFFGGKSVEHDISIITGVMTANSIDKEKFSILPIYVENDGKWYFGKALLDLDGYKDLNLKSLKRVTIVNGDNALYQIKGKKLKEIEKIYMAINCMHGERGEDGSLAGLLKMSDIPFCSPDILPSSISIDKNFSKIVMKGLSIKTVQGMLVKSIEEVDKIEQKMSYPLIVKPNFLGSSIGITKANTKEELEKAISLALKYGESAMIEKCLENLTEINCAAYKDNGKIILSECEKPINSGAFLSFKDKYQKGKRIFPADIDKKYSDKIKSITKKIYESLNFDGIIRIDYFISKGEIYVNEINSVPGSLAYYLFSDTIKGFSHMLTSLIMTAEQKYLKNNNYVTNFPSKILLSVGSKGAKCLKKNI